MAPAETEIDQEQAEAQQAPDYGPKFEDLPEPLVRALKAIVQRFAGQEQFLRRREVLSDRKNRFYERGVQHIYETQRSGGFIQGTAGGLVDLGGRQVTLPNYIDDYNIFQPYLRVIESILTQNPPGIDFRPDDPSRVQDVEAAETCEDYRHLFQRSNDEKGIQTDIVRMMGLSGRTIIWTRTEANRQKFGLAEDDTPAMKEIATVYGTIESRVPILAKTQDACLYLWLFDDLHVQDAKGKFESIADKIKPGATSLAENAYERTARLGVLQGARSASQMGDAYSHLVTVCNCWLRPNAFITEDTEKEFENGQSIRDTLNQLFPEGVHVTFVGEEYACAEPQSMDDGIVIGHPYKGDGMYRMALMDPMIVVQDRFNDSMNAAAEVWDFGWPSTWVDADDVEYDAIVRERADPCAIRQLKTRAGQKISDRIWQEQYPNLPPSFEHFVENLQANLPQFQLAAPPAVFGAAMADQKTASGYAQARAQALGQQGLVWAVIQYMMSRMYYQAALAASKNPQQAKTFVIPSGSGTKSVDLAKIAKGKFACHPDEDSSFPESTDAKRATMEKILTLATQEPEIGMQLLSSPENWKLILTLNGFPEIVIPEAQAAEKQDFEIEELLYTKPVPPSIEEIDKANMQHAEDSIVATHTGQPAPPEPNPMLMMKSSVPVDELDYHAWEFKRCQDWLSSKARRDQEAAGNFEGIQNVKLHALEHRAMMIAMAPPPLPAAAPIKPQAPGPSKPTAPPAPEQNTATM